MSIIKVKAKVGINNSFLTRGKTYSVLSTEFYYSSKVKVYSIIADDGCVHSYLASMFESIEELRNNKLIKLGL